MTCRFCTTCFRPVYAPKSRMNPQRTAIVEQCVDPCHDASLIGTMTPASAFLSRAIKKWRGTTRQASLRMYGVAVPPTLEAV